MIERARGSREHAATPDIRLPALTFTHLQIRAPGNAPHFTLHLPAPRRHIVKKKNRTSQPSAKKTTPKPKRRAASAKPPKLLAGGNPQIAKADGDAPVRAYIAAMPGWKREVGRRLDALITRNVPEVRKAVKWNSPFYGVEGQGWFIGLHTFTKYVKVAFFRGTKLRPVPPGASKGKDTRYLDIHEDDDIDEVKLASWVKQAAALPGWVP